MEGFLYGGAEIFVHNLQDDARAADRNQIEHGEQHTPPKPRLIPKKDGAVAGAEHPDSADDEEEEHETVQAAKLVLVYVVDPDDDHEHQSDGQIDEIGQIEKEELLHLIGIRVDGDSHQPSETDGRVGIHLKGNRMSTFALIRRQCDEMPAPAVADLLMRKRAILIDKLVILPDAERLVHRDEKERVDVGRGGIETHTKPDVV